MQSKKEPLTDFIPSGDPEKLNEEGGTKPDCEREVDAALAEFSPLTGAKKYSSLRANAQKIDIPKEGETSLQNRRA